MSSKKEYKTFSLPEGRVIYANVFEKDAYTDPKGNVGKAVYKMELAYTPTDLGVLENELVAAAVAEWGPGAEQLYDNEKIATPLLSGDTLAANREAKDKDGGAYKGKIVIRPTTAFNFRGDDAPGGIYVAGPDAAQLNASQAHEIYSGMFGIAVVSIGTYAIGNDKGLNLYLVGFQKTRDGEKLAKSTDHSTLFKPQAGAAAAPAARVGRRLAI
jgi:hypothetical protein